MEVVEVEDFSTARFAAKGGESSMEEIEAKLWGEGRLEKGKPGTEARRGGRLTAGWEDAFMVRLASRLWQAISASRFLVISFPDLLPRLYHHAKPFQEKPSLEGLVHRLNFNVDRAQQSSQSIRILSQIK